MKKKIFFILFFVVTYLSFSQSITITSPTRGEKLYKGDRYLGKIGRNIQNKGGYYWYTWVLPASKNPNNFGIVRPGDGFRMKVKSVNNPNIFDFSDRPFSVMISFDFIFPPPNSTVTIYKGEKFVFKCKTRRILRFQRWNSELFM